MEAKRASPLKWAGYGAAVGFAYALLQMVLLDANAVMPVARFLGQLVGGATFGAIIGALAAVVRNMFKR